MRTTRRLLEAEWTRSSIAEPSPRDTDTARRTRRPIAARVPALLALVTSLSTVAGMTTSCSSSDGDAREPLPSDADGGADAAPEAEREDVIDAGIADVVVVDSAPLPIECKEPPCAIALSTTTASSLAGGLLRAARRRHRGMLGRERRGAAGEPRDDRRQSGSSACVGAVEGHGARPHVCGRQRWLGLLLGTRPLPPERGIGARRWRPAPFGCRCLVPRRRSPSAAAASTLDAPSSAMGAWFAGARTSLAARRRHLGVGAQRVQPRTIERASGAKDIAVGSATFAIDDDGTMKSWGWAGSIGRPIVPQIRRMAHEGGARPRLDDRYRRSRGVRRRERHRLVLGPERDGDDVDRALPSAVDTPEPITRIATSRTVTGEGGLHVSYFHKRRWCATSVTGAVYCWGLNNAGQAGNGTKEFALEPVQVAGLPAPAAEVKVMPYSTCAILTNGKVYCWGSNFYGQLGAGLPKGSVLQPVEVKLP